MKIMLKTPTFFILMMTLVASNLSYSFAKEGGVSGGGGNFIIAKPPDVLAHEKLVERVAKTSITDTHAYLIEKYRQFQTQTLSEVDQVLFTNLFTKSNNLHQVLQTFHPEIKEHKTCLDSYGQPVDASIAWIKENKFCFSAYTLRNKVEKQEMRPQAIALLVHEYSELLGAQEEEAFQLQKHVLNEISSSDKSN